MGIVVYRSCYLGFFDTLKPILLGENPSITASYILGYTVALSTELISYPLDTKQVYGDDHEDCAVYILRNEGLMSFMKGAGVNAICSC